MVVSQGVGWFGDHPPPTLVDEQLQGGRELRVATAGPTPVPAFILLPQLPQQHRVAPVGRVTAGYLEPLSVGLQHKAPVVQQHLAAPSLPPAQEFLLVAPLVALEGHRAPDGPAEEFGSPGKGGGCRGGHKMSIAHPSPSTEPPQTLSYLWPPAEPPPVGCPVPSVLVSRTGTAPNPPSLSRSSGL